MARPKIHDKYRKFIADHYAEGISNHAVLWALRREFNVRQNELGPIPSESSIQRETKKLRSPGEIKLPDSIEPGGLDAPWRFLADDPDDIPLHVRGWILSHILSNDFIMQHRALRWPKIIDQRDAVTRRTARWIAVFLNPLEREPTLLIWSIAWMYSVHELACLNGRIWATRFDTRNFDYYVSHRPWRSVENFRRYEKAVENGHATHINKTMVGILHRLQLMTLNEPSPEQALPDEQRRFLETTSRVEQDRLLTDSTLRKGTK